MNQAFAALPRKSLQEHERRFLKLAGAHLAYEKIGGSAALADLLDMVASWHALRTDIEFGDYCKRWVQEYNCKNPAANALLRNLLGLDEPPRPARRTT